MHPAPPAIAWQAVELLHLPRLRRIAARLLRKERPNHTLQITALVTEAFSKLRTKDLSPLAEQHRYSLAARAMRQVLIDYSRRARAKNTVDLDTAAKWLNDRVASSPDAWISLHHALDKLAAKHPIAARVLWLRSVERLNVAETADALGLRQWVVKVHYAFAVKWMRDHFS